MIIDYPVKYIDTEIELLKVKEILETRLEFALDLEADVNLHRYGRKLCLAQIWDGNECWLLDLRVMNVSCLKEIMENPAIIKVMYAASFDVSLLADVLGIELKGLFDIQLCSYLLGKGRRSLKFFLKDMFDLDVEKTLQTSDWYRRPLSEEQLAYASTDVRFLLEGKEMLIPLLDAEALMETAIDGFQKVEQSRFQIIEEPYLRVRNSAKLTPYQKIILKELYAVRERLAEADDVPSYRIMRSYHLINLSQNPPNKREILAAREIFQDKLKEHVDVFYDAIECARTLIMEQNSLIKHEIVELRRLIHKHPELPGKENGTDKRIFKFIRNFAPQKLIRNLGRNSSAYIYAVDEEGPTVIFRAEIDGVYGKETNVFEWNSREKRIAHLYGHDGHTAILISIASRLYEKTLKKGKVILLFQSATSNGKGALRLMKDNRFKQFQPDYAFALQTLPGFKKNSIILAANSFTTAITSLSINLSAISEHLEENGYHESLTIAFAEIIHGIIKDNASVKVTYLQLGKPNTTALPLKADIRMNVTTQDDETMEVQIQRITEVVEIICAEKRIKNEILRSVSLPAMINDPDAEDVLKTALADKEFVIQEEPFTWEDDFGHLSHITKAIQFGIGIGEDSPKLGSSKYDFPDYMIEEGAETMISILRHLEML